MAKENIEVTYLLTTQIETPERSFELLLAEMTSGIQYVSTRQGVKMNRISESHGFTDSPVHGEVLSVQQQEEGTYLVKFAFPASNLDVTLGGITNLWPIVAGEVFNLHFIKRSVLVELELPQSYYDYYKGPRFGVEGLRKAMKVEKGPAFGSIIKPNIGLDPAGTANVVSILAKAGFDFVKDDEITVNPAICPLKERVTEIAKTLDKVEQQTGKRILYAADITSDFSVLGKAAEIAVKAGAGGLMIDPFCMGMSSIDYLRRNFDLPIYTHRVGYGIFSLGTTYSIRYEIFTKLFRLLGADFSHVGGIWGKSEASRRTTAGYLDLLRDDSSKQATWPIVTGISLDNMADYYQFYGDDTMFLDHIGLYKNEVSSREKLQALKSKLS